MFWLIQRSRWRMKNKILSHKPFRFLWSLWALKLASSLKNSQSAFRLKVSVEAVQTRYEILKFSLLKKLLKFTEKFSMKTFYWKLIGRNPPIGYKKTHNSKFSLKKFQCFDSHWGFLKLILANRMPMQQKRLVTGSIIGIAKCDF